MAELSIADFEPRLGEAFLVELDQDEVRLTLVESEPLPGSPREAGGFRLEFLGPLGKALAQGVYPFALGGGELTWIFIVPLGPVGDEMRYEAVFF
ncbi:MAG: DUF6916 family protein [Sphingosinicella sp.]|uniref:DUF6916 family protein n=1 Tax=Sphingosinicella sp. TaxID=1917971 RepID=UPI004037B715